MRRREHFWMQRGNFGGIVEITIRDAGGEKIETFKFGMNDKETQKNVARILRKKYNVDLTYTGKEKDLDWLNLNNDFFK